MRSRLLLSTLILLFCTHFLAAQSIESLREELRKAEEEIRVTNKLLDKTRNDRKVTQSQLKLIQNKIRNRKNIVSNLEKQIGLMDNDISDKNRTVGSLRSQLDTLKGEYARMVCDAYKNYKLNNFLVFLFASKDFNDATRRIAYMRRYNQMRMRKAEQIDSLSNTIDGQISELKNKKEELDKTQASRTREIESLGKDESQYKNSASQLEKKEGKLSASIKSKQQQINKLQKQIERIIAEEARKNKSENRTAEQDEYIAALSGRFDQNRGKLPYPIRGGVIVDRYGVHPHPTLKGMVVSNNGVNISANGSAEVRAVFEGTVSRIFFLPGMNNSLIIRHGDYFTVYSNLETVLVKPGDKVSLNQPVGRIGGGDDQDLHFEIWKGMEHLDPESWLKR